MRRAIVVLACWVSLALVAGRSLAIDTEENLSTPERQALYDELIHEVRCLVCQNQTIGDSTAPLASDLRREIHRLVEEGKSKAAIETFLLERYGDFALYKPRFTGSTALLWLAPVILLLLGAVTLGRILQRRRGLPSDIDADAGPAAAGDDQK